MPNWNEVLHEINRVAQKEKETPTGQNPLDTVRRDYLSRLFKKTGRNTIAYYSGWLQKGNHTSVAINDKDKSALMLCINKLDRSKGLDLILHTPGGDLAATESIVDYLRAMFGKDIRAVIPQISMSAGTMIALSCKEIVMGKQSNIGPIDPQINGIACQAVLDEFEKAKEEVRISPWTAPLWQEIIRKYHPTFLGTCEQSIDWSQKLVEHWLESNMLEDKKDDIPFILDELGNHKTQKSHARHISVQKCKDMGLKIVEMEEDNELQDLFLTVHHAFMHTFSNSTSSKIVENHLGVAFIESLPININPKRT